MRGSLPPTVAALVAANEKKTKESLASSEAKVKKQVDAGQKALKDKVEAMYPTFMKVKCANEGLHFDVKSVACCKSGLVYDAKAGKCDKPKLGMLKGVSLGACWLSVLSFCGAFRRSTPRCGTRSSFRRSAVRPRPRDGLAA